MRLLAPAFVATALLGALLFACSGSENAPTDNAESDYTRQGGVVGQAPKIALGKSESGSIKNAQIDAWAIDLRVGDKITVVETIRKGTLTPDFGLFSGGVLLLVGSIFSYFRLDNATRGYYTGRLQFLMAAAILAIVGAGALVSRWIVWL